MTTPQLDRLGRSLKHLIETIRWLEERIVVFVSITENIDTMTPDGKLIFHIMGALAEFERDIIVERTKAGLEAARSRGRKGGRPKRNNVLKAKQARKMRQDDAGSVKEFCQTLGISRATYYRYIHQEEASA